MDNQNPDLLEKIRQQFEDSPYPINPLDHSPKIDYLWLYIQNLITPYYLRNQRVIETPGKIILDAGCGTGYSSLVLAEANPGAQIIGIDLSEKSVAIAQQRLQVHGFDKAEFYPISIEELPKLGKEFDYINCDEVLYLLPNPVSALQIMRSILKPEGIIRSNLHSSVNRFPYFRAQELFKMMGLMDDTPQDMAMELVCETMKALKDQVLLKRQTWDASFEENRNNILTNYLLQGDKGFTIPEMFSILEASGLEFISMVNWRQWDLISLFKEPDDLPMFLGMSLPETSLQERLHLFELLHPVHRLLDFWCGHPNQAHPRIPVTEWANTDWQEVRVHLHPQLSTPAVRDEMLRCIIQLSPFEISNHLPLTGVQSLVDSTIAACLLPLLESAQPMSSLVERWQQLRPVHPITLEATTPEEAFELVKQALTGLEENGYVLLERQS
ncbi:class I SAM-dependent methyltransferase [Coleofasciculus sp. G2-EDA-02]|uniref:class I SAM-dependent methyltransferase n=1 Tax=Coleofasciculus sp. G2-EDA-02 TaxID=3069529 RepID=UPI0032F536F4